jgi:hypothetical protein
LSLALAASLAGCEQTAPSVPVTIGQYEAMSPEHGRAFPPETVVLANIQRVLDGQLATEQRMASLELVIKLGGDERQTHRELAGALAAEQPQPLRNAVLKFLISKDYPGIALSGLPAGDAATRGEVLAWLARHPEAATLADIVKAWAAEPPDGPNEQAYRLAVYSQNRAPWQQVLLESINAASFKARGSALEVLAKRLTPADLRQQISRLRPNSDATAAMQMCIRQFDYVPANGSELLGAVIMAKSKKEAIAAVAVMVADWRKGGYAFRPRDYPLLEMLATDPAGGAGVARDELQAAVLKGIIARQQATPQLEQQAAASLAKLSMAELWMVRLVSEMLDRPQVRQAIGVMASLDRSDTRWAWGGLVRLAGQEAVATLYPCGPEGTDLHYIPGEQALAESASALCLFAGRFEKVQNAQRAGPDADDLKYAAENSLYGLVLTSLDERSLAAHFYTPAGLVVHLGVVPLAK